MQHNASEVSTLAQNAGDAAEVMFESAAVQVVGPVIADVVGDQVGDATTAFVDYIEDNVQAYFESDSALLDVATSVMDHVMTTDSLEEDVVTISPVSLPDAETLVEATEDAMPTTETASEAVADLAPTEAMKCLTLSSKSRAYRAENDVTWYSILVPSAMRENNPSAVNVWQEDEWVCISSMVEMSPDKLLEITYRLRTPAETSFDWEGYEVWANRKGRIKVCLPVIMTMPTTGTFGEGTEDATMEIMDASELQAGERSAMNQGLSGTCRISIYKKN
jgi:hypothetical protein